MLNKRLLTAAIGVPAIVWVLISDEIWLTLAISVISIVGMIEFFKAVGLIKNKFLCTLGLLGSILICFGDFLNPSYFMTIVYAYTVLLCIAMLASHKTININEVALVIIGNIYIPYFLTHIILTRHIANYGYLFVWFVFIGAFMTDTFAYFVGKFLGRHKLCPGISPKKTIEGAIGGVLGCGLCFLLYGYIMKEFFLVPVNMPVLFLLGILCAVVSELGDLVASMIKRQYNIKDFGDILPGHGGILDRFDSVLFVAPIVYLFLCKVGVLL